MAAADSQPHRRALGLAFVHGAGLGAWIWEPTAPFLALPSLLTDFPHRDGDARTRAGLSLDDYAAHVAKAAIRKGLCNDLSPAQADEVVRHFAPEARAVCLERVSAGPPSVPRTFVRLTDDNELDLRLQGRMAENLGAEQVRDIASGHLAMIATPSELAEALNAFGAALAPGARRPSTRPEPALHVARSGRRRERALGRLRRSTGSPPRTHDIGDAIHDSRP